MHLELNYCPVVKLNSGRALDLVEMSHQAAYTSKYDHFKYKKHTSTSLGSPTARDRESVSSIQLNKRKRVPKDTGEGRHLEMIFGFHTGNDQPEQGAWEFTRHERVESSCPDRSSRSHAWPTQLHGCGVNIRWDRKSKVTRLGNLIDFVWKLGRNTQSTAHMMRWMRREHQPKQTDYLISE